MKPDEIHSNLLRVLQNRAPKKNKLVEILMDTLCMEKRAIQRRLNGEVQFSFYEVVKIAEKLEISLSSFDYSGSMRKERFEINFVEYINMSEEDFLQWEDYIALISAAKNDPDSELAESSNQLPISIYGQFESLSKYFLLKYQYLLHGTDNRIPFSELHLSDRYYKINQSYFHESKKIAKTTYIWDYMLFQYLATDLRFFTNICLISAHDLELIKKDLFALLEYIEKITLSGVFEETKNSVTFYISDLNLDADYSYVKINNLYLSLVRTFILNSVVSTAPASYTKIKDWIQSLTKSSTLITQSGAGYRADFLEKQRRIISEL